MVASTDGKIIYKKNTISSIQNAHEMANSMAKEILAMGADKILDEIYNPQSNKGE